MVASVCEKVESIKKPKRIRYEIPTYKKVYSVYQYNKQKYAEIWKKLQNLALKYNNPDIFFRVNPYRVLDLCYIKDDNNKRIHTGDSRYIFRSRTLFKIYECIGYELYHGQQKLLLWGEWKLIKDGLIVYFDEGNTQVEIQGTENLPVHQRLKIHIELLRQLRQGVKIKKAVRIAKRKAKKIL